MKLDEGVVTRLYYERTAFKTLAVLWSRKLLIVSLMGLALVFEAAALVLMAPRYTSEAIVKVSFTREEAASATKSQAVAVVDAGNVVDSTARLVRSRAVASAAVARMGLDQDPNFAAESTSWRLISSLKRKVGLTEPVMSKRDLAVARLMRQVNVASDPRSYLISVSATSGDPVRSAEFANTVVFEYMRSQLLQQVSEAFASTEREVTELSAIYGTRHPGYLSGQAKLNALQARLDDLRDRTPDRDLVHLVMGQTVLPAEPVLVPSSPNIIAFLGISTGIAFIAVIWLALFLGLPKKANVLFGFAPRLQA